MMDMEDGEELIMLRYRIFMFGLGRLKMFFEGMCYIVLFLKGLLWFIR